MWLINWILLIGAYSYLTIIMLFVVGGWFGYTFGTIWFLITLGHLHLWANWPVEKHKPKQDLRRKKPVLYGRRNYR
tara:strand:- start:326 stop:553 length:228 start_codon:yes stop_codon:yes gene_type:complete